MEDERSNIFHRLKLCTFGVELLGSESGNMASDIVPTVFLILPAQLRLKDHPPAKCPSANLSLDDCQSPHS